MKLNATTIDALALPPGVSEKTYFDDEIGGFGLRLREGGSRRWIVQYDIAGRTRRLTLGSVGVLDPGAARRQAKDILAKVRLGRDPANEKIEARAQAADTFGALLPRYLAEKRATLRPRSFEEVERQLVKHAAPLHRHPVATLAKNHRIIDTLIATMASENGRTVAHQTRASIGGYFHWLARAGYYDGVNPVSRTNRVLMPSGGRERVLSADELQQIWSALGDDDYADVIRLLVYTAGRRSEIGGLRWDEVDLDAAEIRIPALRMKAKKPHVIPLSPPALAILAARRRGGDGLVFSSGRRGFGSWVHCKAVLDARVAEARKAAGLAEPMPAWVQHDFRRVFSTVAHETLGVPPHIVEACLAHAGQGRIAGTYNRALYLDERRRALERWADYVDAAVTGRRRSSEVVNLRKR